MAIGDGVFNLGEVISTLPPSVITRVEGLILVLKAVSLAFIIYVIYVLVMALINYRNIKRMKFVEKKVVSIEKKLDLMLKGDKKK